jgi:hypothetical protein
LALAVFATQGGSGVAATLEHRRVFVVDSFEGLPPPNPDLFPVDAGDKLSEFSYVLGVSQEEVRGPGSPGPGQPP